MSNTESQKALVAFHAEMLVAFHREWRACTERNVGEEAFQRICYHLCEHAGNLFRFTGDREAGLLFSKMLPGDLEQMAYAACGYVSVEAWVAELTKVAQRDAWDESTADRVGAALDYLDTSHVAVDWANLVTWNLRKGPPLNLPLMGVLADTKERLDFLGRALQTLPELTLPALERFAGIRAMLCAEASPEVWWLGDAQAWLQREEENFTQWLGAVFKRETRLEETEERDDRRRNVWKWMVSTHRPAASVLAAAASSEVKEFTVDCVPKCYLAIERQTDGTFVCDLYEEDGRQPEWVAEARVVLRGASGAEAFSAYDSEKGNIPLPPLSEDTPVELWVYRGENAAIGPVIAATPEA